MGRERDSFKEFAMDMYTLKYLTRITSKDLLYSTENSAQCYVQPGWERSLGENGYVCLSPFTVHLKLS